MRTFGRHIIAVIAGSAMITGFLILLAFLANLIEGV